jgi:hypothetical protein
MCSLTHDLDREPEHGFTADRILGHDIAQRSQISIGRESRVPHHRGPQLRARRAQ